MRLRFSLKWILISFALFGVVLYLFVIRPTAVASQLIYLVKHRQYREAESLCDSNRAFCHWVDSEEYLIEMSLEPRTWRDVLRMQRRFNIRSIETSPHIIRNSAAAESDHYLGVQTDAVAGLFRVRKLGEVSLVAVSPEQVETALANRETRSTQ